MGISLARQGTAFLYAIVTGLLLGVFYDFFRVARVFFGVATYSKQAGKLKQIEWPLIGIIAQDGVPKRGQIFRYLFLGVGDVLYALLSAAVFSIFLYHYASGCFRWFYLLGAGVGFFGYYCTLGRLLISSSETVVLCIRVLVRYVLWVAALPLRLFRWLFGLFVARVFRPVWKKIRYRVAVAYTHRQRRLLPRVVRVLIFENSVFNK